MLFYLIKQNLIKRRHISFRSVKGGLESGKSSVFFFLLLVLFIANTGQTFAASTKDITQAYQNKLQELERDIDNFRKEIQNITKERQTLSNEIKILEIESKKIEKQIQATDIAINQTQEQIEILEKKIQQLENNLERKRKYLSVFLQNLYEKKKVSFLEMFLREDRFSSFFNQVQAVNSFQESLQGNINDIKTIKADLDNEKEDLENQKLEQFKLKNLQQIQKRTLNNKIAQKESLIAKGKQKEGVLTQKKSEAEKAIQEIRNRIYLLQGLASSITLDEAYRRAQKVAQKVNIRPAFLMAVLKKESDWGSNVGGGNWKKDMNPKDWEAFKIITEKLHLNPDLVPVSSKPSYGWGGAMGPAQFLPRTWLQYESQIAEITGHNPPSPWDLDDAFAAAAIKLAANGASAKTWDAEWKAAQIYFAGANWSKPQYSFYGDAVMELSQVISEEVQKLGLAMR